jgi:hypothetical protein
VNDPIAALDSLQSLIENGLSSGRSEMTDAEMLGIIGDGFEIARSVLRGLVSMEQSMARIARAAELIAAKENDQIG